MKYLQLLFVMYMCFLLSCEETEVVDAPLIETFKVYDFIVKTAYNVTDGGYILNCEDRLVKLSTNGEVEWEQFFNAITNNNTFEFFRVAQVIPFEENYYVLASNVSIAKGEVTLLIYYLDTEGNTLWERQHLITDRFEDKPPRANEEFYLLENNYPIGTIDEFGNINIAFSYDEGRFERVSYALMKFNTEGNLLIRKSFDMKDFYGRVYKLISTSNESLMLSYGGRNWFELVEYTSDTIKVLNFNRFDAVSEERVGDPILNNIHEIDDNIYLITGHVDLLNNINVNFITNFDYFQVIKDNNDYKAVTDGLNEHKELFFSSIFSRTSNSIYSVGTKRGLNELIHDVDSDLIIRKYDINNNELIEYSILEKQGLEGVFLNEIQTDKFTIIGYKTSFVNKDIQTFFIKANLTAIGK